MFPVQDDMSKFMCCHDSLFFIGKEAVDHDINGLATHKAVTFKEEKKASSETVAEASSQTTTENDSGGGTTEETTEDDDSDSESSVLKHWQWRLSNSEFTLQM